MSSSRKGNMGFLEHATDQLNTILAGSVKKIAFIPYAAVTSSFEEFEGRVKPVFEKLGVDITSVHHSADAVKAVEAADAVAIGGGNTFALLSRLYENKLVDAIHSLVNNGMPYMGWSAGSNVTCPTICTTNDMPIVQPPSFNAINLVPFQINPHFISGKPAGHNGESREDRLNEFITMNKTMPVLCTREGSALYVEGENATLVGELDAPVFRYGKEVEFIQPGVKFALKDI